jgi:hypothetical protein
MSLSREAAHHRSVILSPVRQLADRDEESHVNQCNGMLRWAQHDSKTTWRRGCDY